MSNAPFRTVVLLCLALPLSACGSPHNSAVVAAARSFVHSLQQGDGASACRLLTPDAQQATTGATDASCADAIKSLHEPGEVLNAVQVWGDTAQVRIGTDVIFLRHIDGAWTVSAAGCERQPEGPYDCMVGG